MADADDQYGISTMLEALVHDEETDIPDVQRCNKPPVSDDIRPLKAN